MNAKPLLKPLDDLFSFPCAFELDQGETVSIVAMHQWPTYVALYAGTPTAEHNDNFISAARKRAAHYTGREDAHVISPPRRKAPTEFEPHAEYLPPVTCAVSLEAFEKGLTVVWFQDHYALPIDEGAAAALRALDFKRLAVEEPL